MHYHPQDAHHYLKDVADMNAHSHTLMRRQYCDLELILNGGFHPLTGFLSKNDYENVLVNCRLASQSIWPIPVVLDVAQVNADKMALGDEILLRDQEGRIIASMTISDIWTPDKNAEATAVYGTQDTAHPGVNYLFHRTESVYVGGSVKPVNSVRHFDNTSLYRSPAELKEYFHNNKIEQVIGFQTRNPMHRVHFELTKRAAKIAGAHLLIHPSVGETKSDDVDAEIRIKCYQALMPNYRQNMATLSLLPLAMRMGGPREALWHAVIRKNYGCTHFIIGRDHAGPSGNFYAPYAAQELAMQYADEIGITILPFEEMHFVKSKDRYLSDTEIKEDATISEEDIAHISGSMLRHLLQTQQAIPAWVSFPEVVKHLYEAYLPKHKQGVTLFFTGLPSSGKSTIAQALQYRLIALTKRTVSILDGDLFRQALLRQNAFTKADRDSNIKQVGLVASEITKHRGIAICACIAPYEETRQWVRNRVSEQGGFVEIYISTPLATCEERDPKGNYRNARLHKLENFTGITDPYHPPSNPDIIVDTSSLSLEDCTQKIIDGLVALGYLEKTSVNTLEQQLVQMV